MSNDPLVLGTRGSDLALAQARMTEAALAGQGIPCRIEIIRTSGDKRPDLKLSEFSKGENAILDKGIFTKELEEALLRGEIDFAVHSLKDVPTDLAEPFAIVATLPRAPVEDVFLTTREGDYGKPGSLEGMTVATSSVRRARQLRWLCPGATVEDIRGNVPTRIRKMVENAGWDGILLARAGLERLGFYHPGASVLSWEEATVYAHEWEPAGFLPAAGQGAVAMEVRRDNDRAREALATINDESTFRRIVLERCFLHRLQAGCETPVGAWTWYEDGGESIAMRVRVFDEEDPGSEPFEAESRGDPGDPEAIVDCLMEGAP